MSKLLFGVEKVKEVNRIKEIFQFKMGQIKIGLNSLTLSMDYINDMTIHPREDRTFDLSFNIPYEGVSLDYLMLLSLVLNTKDIFVYFDSENSRNICARNCRL